MEKLQLELGAIATGSYYEFQEFRKGTMNRIRNVIFRRVIGIDLRELQKKKRKTKTEMKNMEALSNEEFLEIEDLKECRKCGGKLEEADIKNLSESGIELPRFFCVDCNECYEQTDDYSM
jgi:hypothetical protein